MKMLDPEQTLIVATSGGKDSAAMALWLKFESGLPNPRRLKAPRNDLLTPQLERSPGSPNQVIESSSEQPYMP